MGTPSLLMVLQVSQRKSFLLKIEALRKTKAQFRRNHLMRKELQLVQKMKISQLFVVPPENEELFFFIGLVSLTCPK